MGTKDRTDTGNYRIPIAIQFPWGLILGGGLLLLPDSPRYFVKRGNIEIVANEEYERHLIPSSGWFSSWMNCFKGGLWSSKSNLRRTILGTSLQMMQQWTGVNFIFYYSTPFLQSTGAIDNTFLISLIFTLVNVCSTPLSFWTVEKFGRRPLLVWGALGIFIFFFATTWGPGAWILIGEIFPLPIRSRGVGLSTASNWLWNTIIAVITPYMVGEEHGNLKSSVFFVWGGLCTAAFVYSYLLVPETKGLSLEQVDRMMEESSPRTSAKWVPHETFASAMGVGGHADDKPVVEHDVEKRTY